VENQAVTGSEIPRDRRQCAYSSNVTECQLGQLEMKVTIRYAAGEGLNDCIDIPGVDFATESEPSRHELVGDHQLLICINDVLGEVGSALLDVRGDLSDAKAAVHRTLEPIEKRGHLGRVIDSTGGRVDRVLPSPRIIPPWISVHHHSEPDLVRV